MKSKGTLILAVFVTLCFIGSAVADDVWVRAGASGKGKSKDKPYGDLWKAVDRAKRGDVIHVAAGTYHGKGGAGHFTIKTPNLTLVGGYNQDFSERDPFKHFVVLERAKDYKGDWTGLPEGIIAGAQHADHSNLIVDGFVLNGESRNTYTPDRTKILMKGCYKGNLFQTSSANTIVRNCILLNPCGRGIYCTWQGEKNEISNCFIVNTMYCAISTRSAQPDSKILIKNNTIAFGWFYPSMGGSIGVFIGRQGQTIIENNVIAFFGGEGDQPGVGVHNGFGNEDTIMKNNVFFSCNYAFYKYMDSDGKNLVVYKNDEFEDLNDEDNCEDYMLSEAEENREANPGLKPDKNFATMFANFVASEPGKLNMDLMNEWRRSVGLPLQAAPGTARSNFAPPYPQDKVIPGLISSIDGVGAKYTKFASYKSETAAAESLDYEEVDFSAFKKGGALSKGADGKPVVFQAGMGSAKTMWEIGDHATRKDYKCYQLLMPGESTATRKYICGYFLKGTDADKKWMKYLKKAKRYNKKGGIWIYGKAYSYANQNYSYPVGVVVNRVSKKKKK